MSSPSHPVNDRRSRDLSSKPVEELQVGDIVDSSGARVCSPVVDHRDYVAVVVRYPNGVVEVRRWNHGYRLRAAGRDVICRARLMTVTGPRVCLSSLDHLGGHIPSAIDDRRGGTP